MLVSGEEDECYSSDEESYGEDSDIKSEIGDDDAVPDTQYHVLDSRSNSVQILKIWSHYWINFIKNATVTAYYLSHLKFVNDDMISKI